MTLSNSGLWSNLTIQMITLDKDVNWYYVIHNKEENYDIN